MTFKCTKCSSKQSLKKEWIDKGENRLVQCNVCGHRMRLNLEKIKLAEKSHNVVQKSGTVVVSPGDKNKKNNLRLLILESPHNQQMSIDLEPEYTYVIGRNPNKVVDENENIIEFYVNDDYVSRIHCEINVKINKEKVQTILRDLNSRNGTYVNNRDQRLDTDDVLILKKGDIINIGDTVLGIF